MLTFARFGLLLINVSIVCLTCGNAAVAGDLKDSPFIKEFDYIVVGGGTAGCTIAARLSENGTHSVLLLEAGNIPHSGFDVPALVHQYMDTTKVLKIYQSVPQQNASLWNGGVVGYATARILGGGSAINGMVFNRGSAKDYDNWAELANDTSWQYNNLTKYFQRMEDYKGGFPLLDQHGTGGPIPVTQPKYAPQLELWLKAGQHLGYPIADPNGVQRLSFSPVEFSKRFGKRVSAFSGYLKPILAKRPNLKVIVNSVVSRIIFKNLTAIAVSYTTSGAVSQQIAKARREIVLSAGVIGTPELLLKSGIGPQETLQALNITPVANLTGVGQNLQDHVILKLNFLVYNRSAVFIPKRDLNFHTLALYNEVGDGPYSALMTNAQAFVSSTVSTTTGRFKMWADLQIMYGLHTVGPGIYGLETGEPDEVGATDMEAVVPCLILLTRPKSRGNMTLNATEPLTNDPTIDFQFYSHPNDWQAMMEGIHTALKIFEKTPPFQKLGARYPKVPIKACKDLPFRSNEYWRCYIKQRSLSAGHGAGTCKMGTGADDPAAVVDPQLRVIGVEKLRVVDTSIMPNITNANTQVPAYLIAEKAADMILGIE